jgi:trans-L-3-hydroxyproline dehydratase
MPVDVAAASRWRPPADWRQVKTLDAHTGGEPFRVVIEGAPAIPGATMAAKRRWAETQADSLRRLLMWEPRGHADMYGCFLTEPVSPTAHFGVLFLHNAGFSTMCGHGIIAITKVVLETGMAAATDELAIDSPAGLIQARARRGASGVDSVAFTNVPSYAAALDAEIEVPGHGLVRYDLAFGGAYYAIVDAATLGLSLAAGDVQSLIAAGRAIQRAIAAESAVVHPTEPDLGFLYGVIFTGRPVDPRHHSRNVCVFADGEVDRSPTGTGVSARLAVHHVRGEIALGETIEIESLVGSTFRGRALATARCGPHPAIVPEVAGTASITGRHEFWLDPADEFPQGFFLR